jgi:hypothetical protein
MKIIVGVIKISTGILIWKEITLILAKATFKGILEEKTFPSLKKTYNYKCV